MMKVIMNILRRCAIKETECHFIATKIAIANCSKLPDHTQQSEMFLGDLFTNADEGVYNDIIISGFGFFFRCQPN